MAEIQLHNTLSGKVEPFVPQKAGEVRMYTCGPTVYDYAHIGNYRTFVFQDILRRFLKLRGYRLNHVMNLTDVDDRIIANAAAAGKSIRDYTEKFVQAFFEDCKTLSIESPEHWIRATDHIEDMVKLIERLQKKTFTYPSEGSIYYRIAKFPDYGKLSKIDLTGIQAGARVDNDRYEKESARDFALWKAPKPGEHFWETKIGPGRPGWHIECSAMSAAYLGNVFDIHGGGLDLIFPHHENEIAQSRCAHGTAMMANYWMHNGFLEVEGAKMSKSLGNFVTIRELLNDWPGEALRLNMLKTHYRSPIDWTLKGLEESKRVIDSWYDIVGDDTQALSVADERVVSLLGDDLNTSGVITRLHAIASGRTGASGLAQIEVKRTLKASAMLLGLLGKTKRQYLESNPKAVTVNTAVVDALIADRTAARARKDFKESDRIRDELAAMGVVIKDSKEGTTWEIAR
jgi:cysteinyl-tRNA synthetase